MADSFDAIVIGGGPGGYNAAILTKTSLSLGSSCLVDSFNSNPGTQSSDDDSWKRLTYDDCKVNTGSNGNLISTGSKGTITLGSKASVKGNVLLAASSNSISASQVSGSIINNYTSTPFPSYSTPTFSGMKINWILFTDIPSNLPAARDAAYRVLSSIRLPGSHFRTDIGLDAAQGRITL
jgi:hypothetical protein